MNITHLNATRTMLSHSAMKDNHAKSHVSTNHEENLQTNDIENNNTQVSYFSSNKKLNEQETILKNKIVLLKNYNDIIYSTLIKNEINANDFQSLFSDSFYNVMCHYTEYTIPNYRDLLANDYTDEINECSYKLRHLKNREIQLAQEYEKALKKSCRVFSSRKDEIKKNNAMQKEYNNTKEMEKVESIFTTLKEKETAKEKINEVLSIDDYIYLVDELTLLTNKFDIMGENKDFTINQVSYQRKKYKILSKKFKA